MPNNDVVGAVATAEVAWEEVVKDAIAGNRGQYARLARLVTGYLARWRAYDFQPDWDDIVQDVLIAVIGAYEEGRLDSSGAVRAFLRQATRFKFIDRIRGSKRWRSDGDPQDLESAGHWPPPSSSESSADAQYLRISLENALTALPEDHREAILEIHVRGHTYAEAMESTGCSRAALDKGLKLGLARLRQALEGGTIR